MIRRGNGLLNHQRQDIEAVRKTDKVLDAKVASLENDLEFLEIVSLAALGAIAGTVAVRSSCHHCGKAPEKRS